MTIYIMSLIITLYPPDSARAWLGEKSMKPERSEVANPKSNSFMCLMMFLLS